MEFNWIGKQEQYTRVKSDVSITQGLNDKKKPNSLYTNFIFRNSSFLRFSKNNRVVFAIVNDRIYFKEGNEKTGFCLTQGGTNTASRNFKIRGDEHAKNFIGDYDLLWDSKERLNYIDLNKKKYV